MGDAEMITLTELAECPAEPFSGRNENQFPCNQFLCMDNIQSSLDIPAYISNHKDTRHSATSLHPIDRPQWKRTSSNSNNDKINNNNNSSLKKCQSKFCQAQLQLQLELRFALHSKSPTTHPLHPPTRPKK